MATGPPDSRPVKGSLRVTFLICFRATSKTELAESLGLLPSPSGPRWLPEPEAGQYFVFTGPQPRRISLVGLPGTFLEGSLLSVPRVPMASVRLIPRGEAAPSRVPGIRGQACTPGGTSLAPADLGEASLQGQVCSPAALGSWTASHPPCCLLLPGPAGPPQLTPLCTHRLFRRPCRVRGPSKGSRGGQSGSASPRSEWVDCGSCEVPSAPQGPGTQRQQPAAGEWACSACLCQVPLASALSFLIFISFYFSQTSPSVVAMGTFVELEKHSNETPQQSPLAMPTPWAGGVFLEVPEAPGP